MRESFPLLTHLQNNGLIPRHPEQPERELLSGFISPNDCMNLSVFDVFQYFW